MTIGDKLRRIRTFRGYTQAELGKMVGLSGDRIRQYENDVRKPKPELLKKFVTALDVHMSAISDINITTFDDIMHILFLLEDELDLSINKNNNQYSLMFNNDPTNRDILYALDSWYTAKQNSLPQKTDDNEIILKKHKAYNNWRFRYPLDNNEYDKFIIDNFSNIYKQYMNDDNKIDVCSFKDAALIIENLLRNNILIEFGHIPAKLVGHAASIISFDYAQIMSLSDESKKHFIKFLNMLKQLINKKIEIKEETHTFFEHSFIEFHIYSSPFQGLIRYGLKELQERLINNTYDNDLNFKSEYEDLLNKYSFSIEQLHYK